MSRLLKTLIQQIRQPQIRIQILSDLHLEIGQQYTSYTFPVTAPFLLLSGDIGRLIDYDNYKAFLETQASRYKKVFLVLGNHEFYELDYGSGLSMAQRLSEEPSLKDSIVLLNKSRWDDPDSKLTVLGCTLWSAIPEEAATMIETKINDFKKIIGWTTQKHNQIHTEEAEWLRKEVAQLATQGQYNSRQILIATHHAPCLEGTSKPADTNSPWTPAFATDLVTKGNWGNVTCWIFGHTHYSTDFQYNGIRLLANQRGYVFPMEKLKSKSKQNPHVFDPAMVIKL
ncbi:Putative calcineurin-like phosphoesterase [Trichoderma simmonsii]|uniref:Calcineurin-like phosphoesterase n=1 Tax=Trichoderma simmonsii TaxID=1491479 RepID=A0A8G0KZB6_9HYPO|nr:Putative calcineurin-like phosphoesterase [Trichoderma simmonsii]